MAKKDLLKEAIADAKAVKEAAIANAKVALEEAFTPHLKSMLASKLEEMEAEEMEEEEEEVMETETSFEGMNDSEEPEEAEEMEEEFTLESLLAELNAEENINEAEEGEEEEGEEEEGEEEVSLEDMTEDELKKFVEGVIQDMVASGELEGGEEEEEGEEEEGEVENMTEDEIRKFIGDVINEESEEEVEEAYTSEHDEYAALAEKYCAEHPEDRMCQTLNLKETNPQSNYESELDEAYSVINKLQENLKDINLLNAKLLYTNKIFRSKTLTESQKVKVLSTFDKAKNVGEVKMVYETLSTSKMETKTQIKESQNPLTKGMASKPTGTITKAAVVVETDAMVERFQKLAGL